MGEVFRSQPMSYGQLIIPIGVAEETIEKVGELGMLQFVDLNQNELSFNRRYCNELKRCDELGRRIRYFNEMITKEEERKDMNGKIFKRETVYDGEKESVENLEIHLEGIEKELKQTIVDCTATENDLLKIEESLIVSSNIDVLFESIQEASIGALKFVIGVVEKTKYDSVQRLIWRVSRGLVLINSMDLCEESPFRNFIVVYQGEDLDSKITKICQTAGVRMYSNIPIDIQLRRDFIDEQNANKQQMERIFEESTKQKRNLLKRIALKIDEWKEIVDRQKLIYFTLNMFRVEKGSTLVGECWYPSDQLEVIVEKLSELDQNVMTPIFSPIQAPKKAVVPTYIKTNWFTSCFQDLTNSYGTPRYQEVNTSWLNIITFPFLFGIMFSDVGHGIFILAIGVLFVLFQKKLQGKQLNDIILMLFDARWLLVIMGIFAMYGGLVFNEWFGFSIDFFGTAWDTNDGTKYSRSRGDEYVYYFGVDPIWKSASNELYFLNSLKMKLSILIGVFHMTFGIILSLVNHLKYKNWLNVFFKFIPELVFMVCSFGYLSFLIIYKWCAPVQEGAPMLINVFLEMFQNFGRVTEPNVVLGDCQYWIEPLLLAIVIISLLVLFIPKPIFLYMELRKKQQAKNRQPEETRLLEGVDSFTESVFDENEEEIVEKMRQQMEEEDDDEDNEEGNTLMEIIIFNSIHGIEFVLGCISNTASYLRLWALSLAHAQLGAVFLENVFYLLLGMNTFVTTFVGFGGWALITLGVLIGMESLSAFLHTLRLHWIEFQDKFYYGDGIMFTPLALPKRTVADDNSSLL